MKIELERTETHETYSVSGAPTMRDPSRCEFEPETVTVIHRDIPWWVGVKGRRTRSGRYTETGYSITSSGEIEPHYRNGPAPQWLADLVVESDPTRLAPEPCRHG
jgi:hypothetical protein